MDIRIGIRDVAREVTLESDQNRQEVQEQVQAALSGQSPVLSLQDRHGRTVLVPSAQIGYVDIGTEDRGRVGFGTA